MRKGVLCVSIILLAVASVSQAATQQAIQEAINDGLDWLARTQTPSGSEGYWSYDNNGTVAATASAALAFIEEGYLPGSDYVDGGGTNRGDVVGRAVNYVFNQATTDGPGGTGLYFNPGNYSRSIYTTGIVAPMVYALGEAYGETTVVGTGSAAISGGSYRDAMQKVMNWYAWGQNSDPGHWEEGGWGYSPNSGSSDNSTAQWGALPFLYGEAWGLATPASVQSGLEIWTNRVQNPLSAGTDWMDGGSGYTNNTQYVNMSKTGGMLLEFAAQDKLVTNPDVQAALYFMQSTETFDHWNQPAGYYWNSAQGYQWYGGHLNNPYAMWAVYKGLQTYGGLVSNDNGTADPDDDFMVGSTSLIATAPGGFTIGQDWAPQTSAAGDWYSHYSDYLVGIQNDSGSWSGYEYWTGAMATGWYINILNATGAPPPVDPVPVPAAVLLGGIGLAVSGWRLRREQR